MRLVFAGTPEVAIPSLAALLDAGHEVVLVVTQPDAPGKRGSTLVPSPVREYAESRGLDVATPARASDPDFVDRVRALRADAAGVVAYGQLLKQDLLDATVHGWVNLHFSLLPQWRGAAPVQRAIQAGDDLTGATTFVIERGLDTGPVIGHLIEPIRPTDTAGDLLGRLAVSGAPLLVRSLEALVAGAAVPQPQGDDGVSHAAKLTRDDALVRWDLPAHVIDRAIRACTPAPGAWTTAPDGTVLKLGPVEVLDGPTSTPGLVRVVGNDVVVSTGSGTVRLGTVQPAGKKAMDAAAWLRGARLPDSAVLGEA